MSHDKYRFETLFDQLIEHSQNIERARNFIAFLASKKIYNLMPMKMTTAQWAALELQFHKDYPKILQSLEGYLERLEQMLDNSQQMAGDIMITAENLLIEIEKQDE